VDNFVCMKKKSSTRNRFTDEQKRAALADMAGGMTIEQTSKRYGCSPSALSNWKNQFKANGRPAKKPGPVMAKAVAHQPEPQNGQRWSDLEQENRQLRKLLLNSYIVKEPHPKLQRIATIIRDNGWNQLQEIMEVMLATGADTAVVTNVMVSEEPVAVLEEEQQPYVEDQPSFRIRRKGKLLPKK
jgi:transposase-like protein